MFLLLFRSRSVFRWHGRSCHSRECSLSQSFYTLLTVCLYARTTPGYLQLSLNILQLLLKSLLHSNILARNFKPDTRHHHHRSNNILDFHPKVWLILSERLIHYKYSWNRNCNVRHPPLSRFTSICVKTTEINWNIPAFSSAFTSSA